MAKKRPAKKKEKATPLVEARWKKDKISQTEASEAGRATVKKRWEKMPSAEDRSRLMKKVADNGAGRPRTNAPRCPCGAMTEKLAEARKDKNGKCFGHKKGCPYYKPRVSHKRNCPYSKAKKRSGS